MQLAFTPKGPDSFVSTYKISKCNCLGSWRPPTRSTPPTGNPGSATEIIYEFKDCC